LRVGKDGRRGEEGGGGSPLRQIIALRRLTGELGRIGRVFVEGAVLPNGWLL